MGKAHVGAPQCLKEEDGGAATGPLDAVVRREAAARIEDLGHTIEHTVHQVASVGREAALARKVREQLAHGNSRRGPPAPLVSSRPPQDVEDCDERHTHQPHNKKVTTATAASPHNPAVCTLTSTPIPLPLPLLLLRAQGCY